GLPGRRTMRVLVVDDAPDVLATFSVLLKMWGHEVRVAADGLSALALAADFRPDAVLLDVSIPGADGFEVARRLRALPGGDKALLVAATGLAGDQLDEMGGLGNFDLHLQKPINLDELKRAPARHARPS